MLHTVYQIYKKYLGKREEEKAPEPHVKMLDILGSKINMGFEKEEDGPGHSKMENGSKAAQFQQVAGPDMTSPKGILWLYPKVQKI